jgi:hypothetical protein
MQPKDTTLRVSIHCAAATPDLPWLLANTNTQKLGLIQTHSPALTSKFCLLPLTVTL